MVKDYYEILGLRKDCTKEEIRKAYLRLSKTFHPDINDKPDAEENFKLVNEAYSALYEGEKREEYDAYFEEAVEAEKEFKAKIKYVDLFIKYINLMRNYRPVRKVNYEMIIEDIYSNIVEATLLDYEVEDKRLRSGSIVTIKSKLIFKESLSEEEQINNIRQSARSEFSALGMIFLVKGNEIKIEILDMKKAKLIKKNKAKLKLEEDTRFLFDNIERHMSLIMDNPVKYKNFRSLLTDIYTDGELGLSEIGIYEPKGDKDIDFIFKDLNDEQRELVKKSVEIYQNPKGYIIAATGPGGTGKTECIVEIIRQLMKNKEDINILVTSFTNVAVDNVFAQLLKKDSSLKEKIIRVAFEQRIRIKEVRNVCLTKKKKGRDEPKVDLIKKHNVIGATLDKIGTALFNDFEFDFVIIDECSMVEFPKIMLAAAKSKKMFLIGDAQQLNPFIEDNVKRYLKKNGIDKEEVDYLERSFFSDLIQYLENTKSTAIVKFIWQHRSYPEIIKFPNEQFYNHILKTKITDYQLAKYNFLSKIKLDNNLVKDVIDPKKRVVWVDLQNLPESLRFSSNKDWSKEHGIRELRYFHIAQAAITIMLLKRYLNEFYYEFKKDPEYRSRIGIISPFNDQVELIRKYFYENPTIDPYLKKKTSEEKGAVNKALIKAETYMFMTNLEVGTVHKFQGREKDIIFFDITSYTGVGDPKLLNDFKVLNVAITRAKCKLIIIGAVRDELNYYSDLHDERYAHIIGLRKPTHYGKDKGLEFLRKVGVGKGEYVGDHHNKNIMDYFSENPKLKTEFEDLIQKLAEIENQIIKGGISYDLLSEEEEYDRKMEEAHKIIDLMLIKDSLLAKVKDGELKEEAKKVFSLIVNYTKNQFFNTGVNQKSIDNIREQFTIFLEKDVENLLRKIIGINKIDSIDKKIEEYGKIIKETKSESVVNYIASVNQQKLRKRLKHIKYKEKLEKLLKINLDGYFNIISLNIRGNKKDEFIKKIESMPQSLFVPYGRDICKTLIIDGSFKANHPLDWLRSLIRPPVKKEWDLDLWLCLRANYDKRFGREDI